MEDTATHRSSRASELKPDRPTAASRVIVRQPACGLPDADLLALLARLVATPLSGLSTPSFGNFPPTPRSPLSGLAAPAQRDAEKKDD